MTPDEYRSQLLEVSTSFVAAILSWLRLLPPTPSDRQWADFVDLVYREIMAARLRAFVISRDYYAELRPESDVPMPELFERRYPRNVLDAALSEAVRARLDGDEDEIDRDMIESEASAVLERHALGSGRDAILDAVNNDPIAIGYARVPSGAETCAFCLMLVSRGAVYKTRDGALFRDGTSEPYHNRCDCVVVPVFNEDDWPGRESYLEAEALYKRARRKYPKEKALRAVRQLIEDETAS